MGMQTNKRFTIKLRANIDICLFVFLYSFLDNIYNANKYIDALKELKISRGHGNEGPVGPWSEPYLI